MLLLEKGHCLRNHTLSACSAQNKPVQTDNSLAEATNLSTMVQLVSSGFGCALLPDMAIHAGILNATGVQQVPLLAPQPTREIALVTRSSHPKLALIENQVCRLIKAGNRA